MKNREITYYSLLPSEKLAHIEQVAERLDEESFITLGFDHKWYGHLWIPENNECFIEYIGKQTDLQKLDAILGEQLKLYARKHREGFEKDKGDFYGVYKARKDWLRHTIFICKNEYNKTKNEIFKEAVNWCESWQNEWLETFNPYSPGELRALSKDLKTPLWQTLDKSNEPEPENKSTETRDLLYFLENASEPVRPAKIEFYNDVTHKVTEWSIGKTIDELYKEKVEQINKEVERLEARCFSKNLDNAGLNLLALQLKEVIYLYMHRNNVFENNPEQQKNIEEHFKAAANRLESFLNEVVLPMIEFKNSKTTKDQKSELSDAIKNENEPAQLKFSETIKKENTVLSKQEIQALLTEIKSSENRFWRGLPMEQVVNHFEVLTSRKSKNGKPYLTLEQFISFLKKGFLDGTTQPKQKINCSTGEKGFVIKRFYQLWDLAVSQYGYPQKKKRFISLFNDCFDNWEPHTIETWFKPNKTKENW